MVRPSEVQLAAEAALNRLVRQHLTASYNVHLGRRSLTKAEIALRLAELRGLKEQYPGMAGATTLVINRYIRQLLELLENTP